MIRNLILAAVLATAAPPAFSIEPGEPFDYPSMAFYPDRWKDKELDLPMIPWSGEHIALVTIDTDLDPTLIGGFVDHLDAGWALFEELTESKPRLFKNHQGKATIVALPDNSLSCGYGCGYVGSTGIEMTHFYDGHFPGFKKNSNNVPHAYFYEMGRNFFTFGNRHSCFTTGFAVFMRYVCIDTLKLDDGDIQTRKTIDSAIDLFKENEMDFIAGFTSFGGHGEKGNRLNDASGKAIVPSDQNVLYASLLLKLRKEHGGNDWVKEFFRQIKTLPKVKPTNNITATRQCVGMMIAASLAANEDLTPIFTDRYKLIIDSKVRIALSDSDIDWKNDELTAGGVLKGLPAELVTDQ